MEKRLKIASIILYITAAIIILFGIIYSLTPKIMPYHERFLGTTHDQLDPKVGFLFLQSLKLIGALLISIGITLIMLVKKYFSKGDNWIRWIIFIMLIIALLSTLKVTLSIGLFTPWWVVVILIILVIAAFILSRNSSKEEV